MSHTPSDPENSPTDAHADLPPARLGLLLVRSVIGGVLMGLANLVPGISGGTMLVAAGIYNRFIHAIAEASTFRFRLRSVIVLVGVIGAAGAAIGGLAGVVVQLVADHPTIMFSLFIGLTDRKSTRLNSSHYS